MGFLSSLFGVSDRTPETKQIVQSRELPEELAPYVKDVLSEAQTMYKADTERGYDPYTGQMIADFTPQEQQAMAGLESLVGTTRPYLEEAVETYRRGGDEFTAEVAEQYMSPYQRAVTDIQKREAQRDFEGTTLPRLEAQAIQQGAMSGLGSRAGVEMAEAQRNQSQLLADIEARGQQAAFADARTAFEAQKARERAMAGDVARTGTAQLAAGLQEQGVLQTVGEQQRGMGQAILDEAYGRFLEERNFPKQTLSDYSSTIYGAAPSFKTGAGMNTTSTLPGAPSMGQQLLGLGMAGLNAYQSGGLGTLIGGGNPFMPKRAEGGPVIKAQSGLSLQDQINELKERRKPLLFNPKYAQHAKATGQPAYKQAVGITDQINFLQDIQKEDEVKIQEKMKNLKLHFPNMSDTDLRKRVTQRIQPYTPSQVKGGRGTVNPPLPATGLASITNISGQPLTKSNQTTSKGDQPTTGTPPILTQLAQQLSPAYRRRKTDPIPTDQVGMLKADPMYSVPQPDVTERVKGMEDTIKKRDKRFDIEHQRKKKTENLNEMIKTLRGNLTKRVEIQEEGYTEEDEKLNDFLDEAETSIREEGAGVSDIVADAIDKGMQEPTIVMMLTKVLNTNEKGLQKRAKETSKLLRDLNKQKFIMNKELRKEKRTDKLTNAEKESEIILKKIAGKAMIQEDIERIPSELINQVYSELTNISKLKTDDLNRYLNVMKTIATFRGQDIDRETALARAAAASKPDGVKASDYNSLRMNWINFTKDIFNPNAGIIDGKPMPGKPNIINSIFNESVKLLDPKNTDTYKGQKGMAAAIEYQTDMLKRLENM